VPDTSPAVVVGSGAAGLAPALAERTGPDYSSVTDYEALDAIEYFATLGPVQRGSEAAARPEVSLARYQESRIRPFHGTLDEYLRT
jgi:hypothetical protein